MSVYKGRIKTLVHDKQKAHRRGGALCICLFSSLISALDGSLCGGEAGDGNAEGAAGDIVQTDLVAELHRGGVAAMLTADAQMQVGAGGTAELCGHLNELAHAGLIQTGKGIGLINLLVVVRAEELAGVVTAEAEGR